MSELFTTSAIFGCALSLLAFMAGNWLKNKFHSPIFNPLMIAVILCILFLVFTGTDYETYYNSARYLGWFLTPATVCLAIPLY